MRFDPRCFDPDYFFTIPQAGSEEPGDYYIQCRVDKATGKMTNVVIANNTAQPRTFEYLNADGTVKWSKTQNAFSTGSFTLQPSEQDVCTWADPTSKYQWTTATNWRAR